MMGGFTLSPAAPSLSTFSPHVFFCFLISRTPLHATHAARHPADLSQFQPEFVWHSCGSPRWLGGIASPNLNNPGSEGAGIASQEKADTMSRQEWDLDWIWRQSSLFFFFSFFSCFCFFLPCPFFFCCGGMVNCPRHLPPSYQPLRELVWAEKAHVLGPLKMEPSAKRVLFALDSIRPL